MPILNSNCRSSFYCSSSFCCFCVAEFTPGDCWSTCCGFLFCFREFFEPPGQLAHLSKSIPPPLCLYSYHFCFAKSFLVEKLLCYQDFLLHFLWVSTIRIIVVILVAVILFFLNSSHTLSSFFDDCPCKTLLTIPSCQTVFSVKFYRILSN